MSTFSVTVTRIRDVLPHPNADRLELAKVGDYTCCVRKGQYKAGELTAYIPESAILPDPVLEKLNMKGSGLLAGPNLNRVKAIRLRGIFSQGICYPVEAGWTEGQDVAELLGITKHVPEIPEELAGQVWAAGLDRCFRYDIENVKRHPDVLIDGEEVVFTEKCHGVLAVFGVMPESMRDETEGDFLISSKGLFAQGICFKQNEENAHNIYVRIAKRFDIRAKMTEVFYEALASGFPVYVLGEVIGVQDLRYGVSINKDETLAFRIFDIRVGLGSKFMAEDALNSTCERLGIPRVPILYRGPFSKELMRTYSEGLETVSGQGLHMREGIVVCTATERQDSSLPACSGRVKLKSISEAYLLRVGLNGEEPTEFE